MRSHTKRIKWGACTVGALTAAVLAVSATPAAASGTWSGRDYVYGASTFTDDWGDEGITDRYTHTSSNATCLWQKILFADGYLASSSDVDGVFGNRTYNATVAWQRDRGLAVDGSAGKASWGRADGNLVVISDTGDILSLEYIGYVRNFSLKRHPDGVYQFVDGDGTWRNAGYNYRTCS